MPRIAIEVKEHCNDTPYISCVCNIGTKSCDVHHTCKFLNEDGTCQVASELAGIPATPKESNCRECFRKGYIPNKSVAGLAVVTLLTNNKQPPKELVQAAAKQLNGGPGTELHSIYSWFTTDAECKCESRAAKMDIWGPDKCEEEMETILDWLQESAKRKHLPFIRPIVKVSVQLAIRRAREKPRYIED